MNESPKARSSVAFWYSGIVASIGTAVVFPGLYPILLISVAVVVAWAVGLPRHSGLRWIVTLIAVGLMVGVVAGERWTAANLGPVLESEFQQTREATERRAGRLATALRTAATGASDDQTFGSDGASDLRLFQSLQQIELGDPASSIFIVDRDGVALAWAGAGLRHALPEASLPVAGSFHLSSFTATTIGHVEPLTDEPDSRRLVLGASYSSLEIPWFLRPPAWLLPIERDTSANAGRLWAIDDDPVGGHLRLRVHEDHVGGFRLRLVPLLACLMIGLLAVDIARPLPILSNPPHGNAQVAGEWKRNIGSAKRWALFFAVVVLIGVAMATSLIETATGWGCLLLLAIAVTAATLRPQKTWTALLSIFSLLACLSWVVVWLVTSSVVGTYDLDLRWVGRAVVVDPEAILLLLASWLGVVLIIRLVLHQSRTRSAPWVIWGSLAVATGAHGTLPVLVSLLLLLAAACGLAVWLAEPDMARSRQRVFSGIIGAALSASIWTMVLDGALNRELATIVDPSESSFSAGGRDQLRGDLRSHFSDLELRQLTLGLSEEDSQSSDLALLLWQSSPLARTSGPSALRLTTDERVSFFGFGLDEAPTGVRLSTGFSASGQDEWLRNALVRDVVNLTDATNSTARVELFAVPAPRSHLDRRGGEDLARRFLLGDLFSAADWPTDTMVEVGPWSGEAAIVLGRPLSRSQFDQALLGSDSSDRRVVEQWFEESFSLVSLHEARGQWTAKLLRTAVHWGVLLIVGLVGAAAIGVAAVVRHRSAAELLGPFARRLVLAFALLASVPIVLLTGLLLQSFSERLQENQRASGEAALGSAERMVGDYLSSLDPGFSVTAVLDDELLSWISLIVQHEVNLYWRGSVLTSSRPELFSAGLLPSQIPGDVFAALDLQGGRSAARFNRSGGDTRYLELYRRVELPGSSGRYGLYVSVPLLAQELATTFTLRSLSNQALILAVALTLLLVAMAVRFADGLTRPITAMVAGTKRIAEGDESLGLEPGIPELRTLAMSIDDMARRIASGRERLLREKRVVDTVVANIKSAVVSFGQDERVVMVNRQAADLLQATPGDSLAEVTARIQSEELANLVGRRPSLPERTSVRLGDGDETSGQEWTVQWLPISGGGDPAALLVLEDVTEVLRAQRLAAWAEMARIIAHEVKNPLTPIRLSADHLQRVYDTAPERLSEIFDQCIGNILSQVEELRLTAEEFSTYSRIPVANKSVADLRPTVLEIANSYSGYGADGFKFTTAIADDEVLVEHDRRLIGRVLRNLYENAIRACGKEGHVHLSLALASDESNAERMVAVVEVCDSGPGVTAADLPRIFEPTFSASSGGTGLGLPIARSIIEDHGGSIEAHNAGIQLEARLTTDDAEDSTVELNGLCVSIVLPLAEEDQIEST